MPIPPTIPPMHWLRAIFGLMTRQDGIRVTTPGRCPASDSPRCHRHIGSAWSDHGTTSPGDPPRRRPARRVRRKSLYLWDSSDIGRMPSNPLAHVANEWANATPDATMDHGLILSHASTRERRSPAHSGNASKQSAAMTRKALPPIRWYRRPEARVSSAVARPTHNVP